MCIMNHAPSCTLYRHMRPYLHLATWIATDSFVIGFTQFKYPDHYQESVHVVTVTVSKSAAVSCMPNVVEVRDDVLEFQPFLIVFLPSLSL